MLLENDLNEEILINEKHSKMLPDFVIKNLKKLIKDLEEVVIIKDFLFFILNCNFEIKFDFDIFLNLMNSIKYSNPSNLNQNFNKYILVNDEKYYLLKINQEMIVFKNGYDNALIIFGNLFKDKLKLIYFLEEYSKYKIMNYLIFKQVKTILKLNNII